MYSTKLEQRSNNSSHHVGQFKIRNKYALSVWSLAFGTAGGLWLGVDLSFSHEAISNALWGDLTSQQKWGALFDCMFFLIHGVGGIVFLSGAIAALTDPYGLVLNRNGQVIVRSLLWRRRIAIKSVQSIELERRQDPDLSWSSYVCIQHDRGQLALPLFKGHEKFAQQLRTVCPAIEIINI
jgi:hypothetical protein